MGPTAPKNRPFPPYQQQHSPANQMSVVRPPTSSGLDFSDRLHYDPQGHTPTDATSLQPPRSGYPTELRGMSHGPNSPLPQIPSDMGKLNGSKDACCSANGHRTIQNDSPSHCDAEGPSDEMEMPVSNEIPAQESGKNQPVAVPGTPLGFNRQASLEEQTDGDSSSLSLMLSSAEMSVGKDSSALESWLGPVRGQTAFLKSNYGSKSNVNLLPTEASIDSYRRNAAKTKDPEVLYTFAKVLIKAVILAQGNGAQGNGAQGNGAQGNSAQGNSANAPCFSAEKSAQFLEEANGALRKAAKCGYHDAEYLLGDAYSIGLFKNGVRDNRKALKYFEAGAKAKHPEAAYRTAVCYRKGWGCTPDARKVVKYTEIAALNAHPVAMMEYGMYLFHGMMGLPADINTKKSGLGWLKRATECATEASCGAPYELATIYLHGFKDILIKDEKYAVRLLYQAAALGHAKSAALLGKYYEIGDKVAPDAALSIHFYNVAAELGDAAGMMGLCSWYFAGSERMPQDYDEAFAWAERAAAKRDLRAMLSLARFYEAGIGCAKDMSLSRQWAQRAEERRRECERELERRRERKSPA